MTYTQTWFDYPEKELDHLIGLIEWDNGTAEKTLQPDGLYTVVGTYPGNDPEIPTEPGKLWMEIAKAELEKWKTLDQAGRENKIKEYFSTCAGGPTPDLTLWCSAFVNYCIKNAGLHGTNDAGARSWEKWHDGKPEENFVPGCIVVFKRGDKGKGHVGFFVGMDGTSPRVLGGNQGKGHGVTLDTPQLEVTAKLMPITQAQVHPGAPSEGKLVWGSYKGVSEEFRNKVREIAADTGTDPNYLMACIAQESMFNPKAKNPNSSATGIMQFTEATAKALGTSTSALLQMTAVQQLEYVHKYFQKFKGKVQTLGNLYCAIFVGHIPNEEIVFRKSDKAYNPNKTLDSENKGYITKADIAAVVQKRLEEGKKYPG